MPLFLLLDLFLVDMYFLHALFTITYPVCLEYELSVPVYFSQLECIENILFLFICVILSLFIHQRPYLFIYIRYINSFPPPS